MTDAENISKKIDDILYNKDLNEHQKEEKIKSLLDTDNTYQKLSDNEGQIQQKLNDINEEFSQMTDVDFASDSFEQKWKIKNELEQQLEIIRLYKDADNASALNILLLKNPGNNCWLNSMLQFLFKMNDFVNQLLDSRDYQFNDEELTKILPEIPIQTKKKYFTDGLNSLKQIFEIMNNSSKTDNILQDNDENIKLLNNIKYLSLFQNSIDGMVALDNQHDADETINTILSNFSPTILISSDVSYNINYGKLITLVPGNNIDKLYNFYLLNTNARQDVSNQSSIIVTSFDNISENKMFFFPENKYFILRYNGNTSAPSKIDISYNILTPELVDSVNFDYFTQDIPTKNSTYVLKCSI
jgi:hypothetical protein